MQPLAIDEQRQALLEGQSLRGGVLALILQGLRHAEQLQVPQGFQRILRQHDLSGMGSVQW
jgi:hypothetical protein